MRFGVPFHYPDDSPGELLPFYRDLGFDEVDVLMARPEIQMDDSVRALVAQAREAGVPAGAVSPRWGWIARAMKDPSQVRQMQAFVEAAPELGTSRVMMSCPAATIRSAAERDEHLRHVAAVYRRVT